MAEILIRKVVFPLTLIMMLQCVIGKSILDCNETLITDVICAYNSSWETHTRFFNQCIDELKWNDSSSQKCSHSEQIDAKMVFLIFFIFVPFGLAIHTICPPVVQHDEDQIQTPENIRRMTI